MEKNWAPDNEGASQENKGLTCKLEPAEETAEHLDCKDGELWTALLTVRKLFPSVAQTLADIILDNLSHKWQ